MESNDAILEVLSELARDRRFVKLLNTYRGVPVAHEARVISANQGYVAVIAHPWQAVCMALEGNTFIQSESLPETLQAKAVAVNVPENQAVLTEFTAAGKSIGKRAFLRVQPREPVDVEIFDGENRFSGKLADISESGLGVFTFGAYIYGDQGFDKGSPVSVEFRLPTTGTINRFNGKVSSVRHRTGGNLRRLGIKITPVSALEPLLQRYLNLRQEEIEHELEQVYQGMRRGRR